MTRILFSDNTVTDEARGTTFTPFVDGAIVGYEVRQGERPVEYVYFNPTTDSSGSASSDVFVYVGAAGDPADDPSACFIDVGARGAI